MKANCIDPNGKTSWQGTLDMIYQLCNGKADLSYDYRDMGGWKLPCVDFRLDAPDEIALPRSRSESGTEIDRWERCSVVLGDKVPDGLRADVVFLMQSTSAAASVYRAFKMSLSVPNGLSIPAEFLWSSVPLAPLSSTSDVLLAREKLCWEWGAIHTIWLNCGQDELVKDAMKRVDKCGELRIQNMTTANTWVIGHTDESRLIDILRREI